MAYKNIFEYESLLRRLALQDGGIMNKSAISRDLGIYNNKIAEMIHVLEKTYILTSIQPFFTNKIKEQIKSPKVYFHDLGFKNALINNFNTLEMRSDKGEIYENFIVNMLIRKNKNIHFWNIQNRYEIDFVYQEGGEIFGIEVKSQLQNNKIPQSVKMFIDKIRPQNIQIFNQNIDDV